MRLVLSAVALFAVLSGSALAQNNADQSPSGKTNGRMATQHEAPVGHRQPMAKDLPTDVLRREEMITPADKKLEKALNICRGC